MKVLVTGSSGFVGSRLMARLTAEPGLTVMGASRSLGNSDRHISLDVMDSAGMAKAFRDIDCIVHCAAGNAQSISDGTARLVEAALLTGCPRIVFISSMAVYGLADRLMNERAVLPEDRLGWYGEAKRSAEAALERFAAGGGQLVILRPGCIYGPGGRDWVARISMLLMAGRIGDLGVAGDGWSNLVHVGDVCSAILSSLKLNLSSGDRPVFNLSAPDSPRWNDYFTDLALLLSATPVRRISGRRLRWESNFLAPGLKILQMLVGKFAPGSVEIPPPIPKSVLGLWAQAGRMDALAATKELDVDWTPYPKALIDSATWFQQARPVVKI